MSAAEFLDGLTGVAPDLAAGRLRQLDSLSGDERDALRGDTVRRLAAGELAPETPLAILPVVGAEPAVPDLVALLRSAAAPLSTRAVALLLLRRYTTYDVAREFEKLGRDTLPELVETAIAMSANADVAAQKGTPFERLALASADDDVDMDEIVDELMDSFCASPEAAAAEDPDELRFWAGELVRLSVAHGFGSPVLWEPADVEEILSELLPRKVTIGSAAEAEAAVPAFRTFFRWAARVAPVANADAIDAELADLEAGFPAMMMDERRFGIAKSFVAKGTAAGFDMSTEEGLIAFQKHLNRQQDAAAAASRKKLEAAKKRKAKMARLSRKKNRRK